MRLDVTLGELVKGQSRTRQHYRQLQQVRATVCADIAIAEESIPLTVLNKFFIKHEDHGKLVLRFPQARVFIDECHLDAVEAYAATFQSSTWITHCPAMRSRFPEMSLEDNALQTKRGYPGPHMRAQLVASHFGIVVLPLYSAEACMVIAYCKLKCQEIYRSMEWHQSILTPMQRQWTWKPVPIDFDHWVKFGSWSCCDVCGSFHFNDTYFRETIFHNSGTAPHPELIHIAHKAVPSDPVQRLPGQVDVSNRWWYLPGMYRPTQRCGCCTPLKAERGTFLSRMRTRSARHSEADTVVVKTNQLYRIPRAEIVGQTGKYIAKEQVTWPGYRYGKYSMTESGESMLELSVKEIRALQIIVLKTKCKKEMYGVLIS